MLKQFQKTLRKQSTKPEQILWFHLRNRSFYGFKFKRQYILQNYIVDFVCLEKKLIIELDGGQHSEKLAYDMQRTEALEKDGFRVLRFWNNELLVDVGRVLKVIYSNLVG